ncbi:MAG: AmmeMemoRadiSam system protein B [Spirochaetota bacterium]
MLDGIFYPNNASHLREAVRMLLLRSDELAGNAAAIVSPHGSLPYSGMHQATAFKRTAARSPSLVVIIGPAVHPGVRVPVLPESRYFRTPLGDSAVDVHRCRALSERCSLVRRDDIPHFEEPSIETALPFIQFLFPDALLLPLLLPNLTRGNTAQLAAAVHNATGDIPGNDVLWVCATNISCGGNSRNTGRRADLLLSRLASIEVAEHLPSQRAGGGYPAATCLALLELILGKTAGHHARPEVLTRGSSFAVDGNSGSSTEYAAVAWSDLP